MNKYIDANKLKKQITELIAIAKSKDWPIAAHLERVNELIDSLQQEQPGVDLKQTVEFECIGKRVKMTVQDLINYYIDSECRDVADECGL